MPTFRGTFVDEMYLPNQRRGERLADLAVGDRALVRNTSGSMPLRWCHCVDPTLGVWHARPDKPIYAIAGQSNAVGNYPPQRSTWPTKIQYSAHQNNYPYTGPMETLPTSVADLGLRKGGVEVRLAERLQDAGLLDARIVKVAFGGTSMSAGWAKDGFWPGDGSDGPDENLREHLFSRIDREVAAGCRLAGFLWWQGYTDAQTQVPAEAYQERLQHLLDALSARYGDVHVLIVRLNSRWKSGNPGALLNLAYHDTMVTGQTAVAASSRNYTLVDPDGWPLADGVGGRPTDGPHYVFEGTGTDAAGDDVADTWGIP